MCSPQPFSAVPGASAGEETGHGSWSQRGLDAEEWQERSRVVHSDPAATIKIGGVRCLHSSLCKSHQPEPCLFLAAGYIIMRSAGGSKWAVLRMANVLQVLFSHPAVGYGLRVQKFGVRGLN